MRSQILVVVAMEVLVVDLVVLAAEASVRLLDEVELGLVVVGAEQQLDLYATGTCQRDFGCNRDRSLRNRSHLCRHLVVVAAAVGRKLRS